MMCEFLKYLIFFENKLRKKFRVLTPYNFNIFTEKWYQTYEGYDFYDF